MSKKLSGGSIASSNGRKVEAVVAAYLEGAKLKYNDEAKFITRNGVLSSGAYLFPNDVTVGEYARQVTVDLFGPHKGKGQTAKVDFAFSSLKQKGDRPNDKVATVLLSVKSQEKDGSAEQKLWFEICELINTQLPAAMLVIGPTKIPAKISKVCTEGWTQRTLEMTWEQSVYHGKNVLLFREYESLNRWLFDKFPIPPKDGTFDEIFEKYCDADPCKDLKDFEESEHKKMQQMALAMKECYSRR